MIFNVRTRTRQGIAPDRREGFALLITLVLVAFLVLILVGLATFARVETQVAANHQQVAGARQQALMAMQIALGKLQESAGPDTRITTTAEAALATPAPGARHWTGVWTSAGAGSAPDRGWLVSGITPSASAFTGATVSTPTPADTSVTLVAAASLAADPVAPTLAEQADYVTVPLQTVTSNGVPGLADTPGGHPIGRFGWWVGDEGVKASIALPDRLPEVTYPPYDNATARRILRAQVPMGPQDFVGIGGAGDFGFDPQAVGPAQLGRVLDRPQLDYLVSLAPSGWPAERRGKFHDWTTVASGVLANTRTDADRGLKRDLSLQPSLLGPAYAAWADYPAHMRTPDGVAPLSASSPAINDPSDLRREHRIVAPLASGGSDPVPFVHRVAPVIAEFVIQFVPALAGPGGVLPQPRYPQLRARAVVSLWNPHSSALILENLELLVLGLPGPGETSFSWQGNIGTFSTAEDFDLAAAYTAASSGGAGLRLRLSVPGGRTALPPGRMVSMRPNTNDGTNFTLARYNNRNLSGANTGDPEQPLWRHNLPGAPIIADENVHQAGWALTAPVNLTLVLRLASGGAELARFDLPTFDPANRALTATGSDHAMGFAYRLNQQFAADTDPDAWWTSTANLDPRSPLPAAGAYVPYGADNLPTTYSNPAGGVLIENPATRSLIDRESGYAGFYQDVPMFELPRLPVLSLGQLQHLMVAGARAFSVGNSWGGRGALWDRFYHSGVSGAAAAGHPEPDLAAGQPLPFVHLRPLPGTTLASLRSTPAVSASQLLMDGAFNVNSPRPAAWRAVLQSLRPFAEADWRAVELDNTTGAKAAAAPLEGVVFTAEDTTRGTAGTVPARASGFTRFPQTAQETWEHDTSGAAASTVTLNGINRVGYRNGLRSGCTATGTGLARNLARNRLDDLATRVADRVKARVRASGPFRSMEEFLNDDGSGSSLLEQAIADANVNADVAALGFSSLWLTQADLLTALGPQLANRSDTFVIRAYGDTLSPATGEVSARAWLEARVQRVPGTIDAADDLAQPPDGPGDFGRAYRVLSFRWLTPDEL
jgi:Tfp pilus assembly protein PilV